MNDKQKALRLVTFLLAARATKIQLSLATYGLTSDVISEGYALVRRVAPNMQGAETHNPAIVEALGEWEDLWYPIASASLKRHYPDVHARIFFDLPQTDGPELVINVAALLDRIAAELAAPGGDEIAALLASRGLEQTVFDHARQLLTALEQAEPLPELDPTLGEDEKAAAVAEMWAFYLEWSAIARAVIKDRNQLRQLGFLKRSKTNGVSSPDLPNGEFDVEAEPEPTIPVVP
jgi:hypothetical protein